MSMDSIKNAATRVSLRTELPQLAVLLAWFLGGAILGAGHEIPVVDDWTYAWSVEHLLRTGRFDVLGYSAVYPFAPTLWGAAWSSWLGFSFVTLRFSSLALGFVATAALYLILRELRAPKPIALLGGLAVAANPMFFLLASSFMTDVPFAACTMMALLCYVRAGSRAQLHLLWWAGFWGLAALLTRQVGLITPVAGLPLLLQSQWHGAVHPRRHIVAALAVTWAVMGCSWWALAEIIGSTYVMQEANGKLQYVLFLTPMNYLVANLNLLTSIGFHALPALLAMAVGRNLWRSKKLALMAVVGAALLVSTVGEIPQPLKQGNIWSVREVGLARGLVNGQDPTVLPMWAVAALRAAGFLAFTLGLTALVTHFRWPSSFPAARDIRARLLLAATRARASIVDAGWAPVATYLSAYLLVVNVLWFYNDRYLLPVLFAFVILALGRHAVPGRAPVLAWCVLALFGATALVGTHDTLRFNEAVRDSSKALVARGVPQSDIDSGYSWNGWMLYAHPQNLAKGMDPSRDVPWITTKRLTPYILATTPMSDYVVEREVVWDDDLPWPEPDRLLVLRRKVPKPRRGPGG